MNENENDFDDVMGMEELLANYSPNGNEASENPTRSFVREELSSQPEIPSTSHTLSARERAERRGQEAVIVEENEEVSAANAILIKLNELLQWFIKHNQKIALVILGMMLLFAVFVLGSMVGYGKAPRMVETEVPVVVQPEKVSPALLEDEYKQIYIENAAYRYAGDGNGTRLARSFLSWRYEEDVCTVAKFTPDEEDGFRTYVASKALGVYCE